MSVESVLLKACFIRNGGVYKWQECQLTLFHIKVTGSLKSDFSASNPRLNQYSLSNHLRGRGIGAQRGELLQRERGEGLEKKQSIQQRRSECGSGKPGVNTEWRTVFGTSWTHNHGPKTVAQRWSPGTEREREREGWIKLKAGILKSSSLCVHFFLKTWLLSKKHRTWLEWWRSPATGCWPPSDRPRP